MAFEQKSAVCTASTAWLSLGGLWITFIFGMLIGWWMDLHGEYGGVGIALGSFERL